MKKIIFIILTILCVLPIFSAEFTSEDGLVSIKADVLQLSRSSLKAKNKIYIKMKDQDGYNYNIKCNLLKVSADPKAETSLKSVNKFYASGNVNIDIDAIDKSTVISHSNECYYDRSSQLMTLIGDVTIDYITKDGEHLTATGTKAVIDLRENLENDDILFSIEGDGVIKPVIKSNVNTGK